MDFEKIKSLCLSKKMTIPELSEKIGMSRAGLYTTIKNQTVTVATLEKIADALEVPVSVFFESETENNSVEIIKELETTNEKLTELTKNYNELVTKYENLLEKKVLVDQLLELFKKGSDTAERTLSYIFIQLHVLENFVYDDIKESILSSNPEMEEKKDAVILKELISKNILYQNIMSWLKYVKPVFIEEMRKFIVEEKQGTLNLKY